MEINYTVASLVILFAVVLIIFLIRKNRKDKKDYEETFTRSELDPEQHPKDQV